MTLYENGKLLDACDDGVTRSPSRGFGGFYVPRRFLATAEEVAQYNQETADFNASNSSCGSEHGYGSELE